MFGDAAFLIWAPVAARVAVASKVGPRRYALSSQQMTECPKINKITHRDRLVREAGGQTFLGHHAAPVQPELSVRKERGK